MATTEDMEVKVNQSAKEPESSKSLEEIAKKHKVEAAEVGPDLKTGQKDGTAKVKKDAGLVESVKEKPKYYRKSMELMQTITNFKGSSYVELYRLIFGEQE